jgi:catechol 2,3-dioxygenase-like lactoylglutathione lyase family enzyme
MEPAKSRRKILGARVPRIGYLALLSVQPDSSAAFCSRYLGLDELGRTDDGDVTLTDGGFNFTLFRHRPQLREPRMEFGFHHLGIVVENIDAVVARYLARYRRGTVVAESGDLQHGEVRIRDPECNPVSLSTRQFGLAGTDDRIARIAHVALKALDTEAMREFYGKIFGFRELFEAHRESAKRPYYRNKHVGDGCSNVAIQSFYHDEVGYEPRFGIAHVGFLVGDFKQIMARVQGGGATVKERPAHRTQSEIRMRDPQGNGCDLSQRGWEVDTDKWVRGNAA